MTWEESSHLITIPENITQLNRDARRDTLVPFDELADELDHALASAPRRAIIRQNLPRIAHYGRILPKKVPY